MSRRSRQAKIRHRSPMTALRQVQLFDGVIHAWGGDDFFFRSSVKQDLDRSGCRKKTWLSSHGTMMFSCKHGAMLSRHARGPDRDVKSGTRGPRSRYADPPCAVGSRRLVVDEPTKKEGVVGIASFFVWLRRVRGPEVGRRVLSPDLVDLQMFLFPS